MPESLVAQAVAGDGPALEAIVCAIQDDVFNLAVRMLWSPDDAADASQEILMKVVTHLSTFRGDSAFQSWVYRIALNHLLNVRKSRVEREEFTFAAFGNQLAEGLAEPPASSACEPDQALLEEEVKIGCTQGMLLCLSREDRIAYILGDVFELESSEAADVLDISAATYRKRLSRARERLRAFMRGHCGLVNQAAACRCARRITTAVKAGRVQPGNLQFAGRGRPLAEPSAIAREVGEMEDLHRIAAIYRSHPACSAPERLVSAVRRALATQGRHLLG